MYIKYEYVNKLISTPFGSPNRVHNRIVFVKSHNYERVVHKRIFCVKKSLHELTR